MNRKTAVLVTLLLLWPAFVAVSPATAAPPSGPTDQQLIAQQTRELDPPALDADPVSGQPRFRPLPTHRVGVEGLRIEVSVLLGDQLRVAGR